MKLIGVICLLFLTFGAILNVESASLTNENDAALEIMETKSVKLAELIQTLQAYLDKFNAELGLKAEQKEEPEIKDDHGKFLLKPQETENDQQNPVEPAQPKEAPEKQETKQEEKQPEPVHKSTGSSCSNVRMYCGTMGMAVG